MFARTLLAVVVASAIVVCLGVEERLPPSQCSSQSAWLILEEADLLIPEEPSNTPELTTPSWEGIYRGLKEQMAPKVEFVRRNGREGSDRRTPIVEFVRWNDRVGSGQKTLNGETISSVTIKSPFLEEEFSNRNVANDMSLRNPSHLDIKMNTAERTNSRTLRKYNTNQIPLNQHYLAADDMFVRRKTSEPLKVGNISPEPKISEPSEAASKRLLDFNFKQHREGLSGYDTPYLNILKSRKLGKIRRRLLGSKISKRGTSGPLLMSKSGLFSMSRETSGERRARLLPCLPGQGACRPQEFYVTVCTPESREGMCNIDNNNNRYGVGCRTVYSKAWAYVETVSGSVGWRVIRVPSGCQCFLCHRPQPPHLLSPILEPS